jgi:hypothetical protein
LRIIRQNRACTSEKCQHQQCGLHSGCLYLNRSRRRHVTPTDAVRFPFKLNRVASRPTVMNRLRNISSADCIILTRAELSPKFGDGRVRRQRLELGI